MRTYGKIVSGIATAVLLTVSLNAPASAKTAIKFGLSIPDTPTAENKGCKAFKDYVEFKSGGELEVQLYHQTLGGEREMAEMVQQGTLEIALVADGALASFYNNVQAFAIPYLFSSSAVAWEFARSPFMQSMSDDMRQKTGIRVLVWYENGFRNMTNSKRPIRGPEDMKGIKMRTMESPVYMRFMEALGASATPIPISELVMSLQQGVVDGQENASSNVYEVGMADVQKYFSTTEHIYSFGTLISPDEFFKNLPTEHQRILVEGAALMRMTTNAAKVATDRSYIERIRDEKGLEVHLTTAKQKEAFRKLTQAPVREYIEEQVGKELVGDLLSAVDASEKAVYGN